LIWVIALDTFGSYGSSLGGLWRFLALGSLAYPLALASSGGLGLIASALGRWLWRWVGSLGLGFWVALVLGSWLCWVALKAGDF